MLVDVYYLCWYYYGEEFINCNNGFHQYQVFELQWKFLGRLRCFRKMAVIGPWDPWALCDTVRVVIQKRNGLCQGILDAGWFPRLLNHLRACVRSRPAPNLRGLRPAASRQWGPMYSPLKRCAEAHRKVPGTEWPPGRETGAPCTWTLRRKLEAIRKSCAFQRLGTGDWG